MHCEKVRLSTFDTWQFSQVVKPRDLARDGFYYTGLADMVQCVFCTTCLFKWQKGSEPSVVHEKMMAECPYIKGLNVGNIFIDVDPRRKESLSMKQGGSIVSVTLCYFYT